MRLFRLFFAVFLLFLVNAKAAQNSELVIKTLEGKIFDLQEKLGKVVIVNFWAQWCADCRRELPILDEIYEKYQSRGVEIIGVSIDRKKDRHKVSQVVASQKYPNALLIDASKNNFDEVRTLPTSYIVGKDGVIVAKLVSLDKPIVKEDFSDVLEKLLQK